MPTRNISLTTVQDAFIDRMVRNGTYQNASEAVRDALRLLRQRRLEDAARLRELRRRVQTGLDDFDRGDFDEVAMDDLETCFAGLAPGSKKTAD
jgi:antitoxin ParD1/3/4